MKYALIAAAAVVVCACDDSAGGVECTDNRECELPNACIGGQCIVECRASRDCPQGHTCFENACYAPVNECVINDECAPFGLVCDPVRKICAPPGAVRCDDLLNPCNPGSACIEGVCRVRTGRDAGVRPDARVADRGVRPDARRPDPDRGVAPPRDQGVDPRRDQGVEPDARAPDAAVADAGLNQAYGEPCRCGSDCASGFCVENKLRSARTCTNLCEGNGDCRGLDVCVQAQQSGPSAQCPNVPPDGPQPGDIVGVCIPNETGLACDPERAQCTGGACVTPPAPSDAVQPQPICAIQCVDDRKCPPGYACQETPAIGPDGRPTQLRLCTPAVRISPCQDGFIDNCGGTCPGVLPEQEVDVTFCMGAPNGMGAGFCSCSCASAADCPTGFACSADPLAASGDPARPALCVPIAGYRCPDGQPSRCSASCLADDENPQASVCTTQCNGVADCPADHGCQPLPGFGSFCVPDPR